MTPDQYEQVVALFQQASDLSPEARETFLARVCAGNGELRQEVEAMLRADELTSEFLETPPNDLAAALLSAQHDLSVNTMLGEFKILSRLGAGGMGVVYLAEDTRLGRKAALKLLPGDFARNPGWLARFEQEARLVSALNHPNIVTVYGISQDGMIHFLATEFVDGRTLREEMASGPMDIRAAIEIMAQVATALSAAHAAGIIHRDVKPENIMLRPDGLVKVLDFGLAKSFRVEPGFGATPAEHRVRTEGVVLGTVRYMSPEQARGTELDPLTDLFSLGVVLYEMVAGLPPFWGETVSDEIAEILRSDPAPLPVDVRDERSELDRIVRKALQKEKAHRYQSAEDLASDLTKLKSLIDRHHTCSHCGKTLLDKKAFCTRCGLPIRGVRCRKCGVMTQGRKFCTSCGEPLQL